MGATPLSRLRTIRDARKRTENLQLQRDDLIHAAIEEGHSERMVAEAAGLSPGRINQIVQSQRRKIANQRPAERRRA